ncbi:MAG: substrate-binding periplasmic protein [Pseudomonadales bacterium]
MKYWLLMLLCTTLSLRAQELVVGVFAYPPEVLISDNKAGEPQFSGRSVAIIRRVISASGYRAKFVELPFRRAYSELQNNRIDLLFPATAPDTEIITLLPALRTTVPGLCFRQTVNAPSLDNKRELSGLKIAYPAGASIEPLHGLPVELVKLYGNNMHTRGLNMVKRRRVDALYHENPSAIDARRLSVQCRAFKGYTASVYLAASADFSWRHAQLFNQLQYQLRALLEPG